MQSTSRRSNSRRVASFLPRVPASMVSVALAASTLVLAPLASASTIECANADGTVLMRGDFPDGGPARQPDIVWTVRGETFVESSALGDGVADPRVGSQVLRSVELAKQNSGKSHVTLSTARSVTLVDLPVNKPLFTGWQVCREVRYVGRPRP